MTTSYNEKQSLTQQTLIFTYFVVNQSEEEEEDVQLIVQHWVRTLNIKLGWIHDFDKLIVNYVMFICFSLNDIYINICYLYLIQATTFFIFDTFCSLSKLLKTFNAHKDCVNSIDYSIFNGGQFICSGSGDKTVNVWDVETNEKIQSFNGHSGY
ncbi:WD40 domain-containing protein, partial [Reticulomyxa filosa]